MQEASNKEIKLIYCYAQHDKALRDELDIHLSNLKRELQLTVWHDREISPGQEWEREINTQLNAAHIILLLVSPRFMASHYCYGTEMKRALERHEEGKALVIPIILRSVDWEGAPFSKLQVLPTGAQPVTRWPDHDDAFLDIVIGIRNSTKTWLSSRKTENKLTYAKKPEDEIIRVVKHLEAVEKPPTIRDLSRYLTRIDVGYIKKGVADLVGAGRLREDKSGKSPRYTTIEET